MLSLSPWASWSLQNAWKNVLCRTRQQQQGKSNPRNHGATRTPEMFKHRTLIKQRVSLWQPAAPEFKSRSHPHQEKGQTHCPILTQRSDAQSRGTVIELVKITLGVSNISLLRDNWSLIHRSLSTVLMISSMWFHDVSGIQPNSF